MDSGDGHHAWIFSSQLSDTDVARTNSKSQLNSVYRSLYLLDSSPCHRWRTDKHFPWPVMDTCYILAVKGMGLGGIRIGNEC